MLHIKRSLFLYHFPQQITSEKKASKERNLINSFNARKKFSKIAFSFYATVKVAMETLIIWWCTSLTNTSIFFIELNLLYILFLSWNFIFKVEFSYISLQLFPPTKMPHLFSFQIKIYTQSLFCGLLLFSISCGIYNKICNSNFLLFITAEKRTWNIARVDSPARQSCFYLASMP